MSKCGYAVGELTTLLTDYKTTSNNCNDASAAQDSASVANICVSCNKGSKLCQH